MPLVVEDGTGLVNAESYASVAEANTYHSNFNNSAWTGTDAQKEAALRKATQYLDATYKWRGVIHSATQALQWPRTSVYSVNGRDYDNNVPSALKHATAELALSALGGNLIDTLSSANYVKREKVGSLEVEYADGSPTGKEFPLVSKLLADLVDYKLGSGSVSLLRA